MSFNCYSISQPKCLKYFYIKKDNKWIGIEEFIIGLKKENNEILLTHDILTTQLYSYRGKEYKYKELFNSLIGNLKIARYCKQFSNLEMGLKVKTHYLLKLIDTLNRYINKARYELIKCSNIIDIDFLNSNINDYTYGDYYLKRCWNAENAIYSYYSTFEILMQIIWIHKDYYKGNNLSEVLESYKFIKLKNKLDKHKDSIFLKGFCSKENNKYYICPKFEDIRTWCNKFKHKGSLRFEGEEFDNAPKIKVSTVQGDIKKLDFSSDELQYEYIDLDYEVIPKLIIYHNEILKLSKYIISNIDL